MVRPYDAGVLFDPARPGEGAAAGQILAGLTAVGFTARANEPYLGTDDGLTTWLRSRYPDTAYLGLEIELSQTLPVAHRATLAATVAAVAVELCNTGRRSA